MPTNTWKECERQTASFFGCRRNPGSGAFDHHSASDSLSKRFFIEVKLRAKSAVWELYRKVRLKAAKEYRTPVIALHTANTRGFLIAIHCKDLPQFISDYLELYGYEINPNDISPIKDHEHRHPTPPTHIL